jgi:hypothetical protein
VETTSLKPSSGPWYRIFLGLIASGIQNAELRGKDYAALTIKWHLLRHTDYLGNNSYDLILYESYEFIFVGVLVLV